MPTNIFKYFVQGRHIGADMIYLTQSYFSLNRNLIRNNANFVIFDQYLTWRIKKYLFNFCKNSEFGNLNWWTNSRAFRGFQFFLQYCCRGKGMKWEINWWKFEESELSELFTKILKISAYFCWEIFIFSKKLFFCNEK